jgi:hypothetical protein
LLVLPELQIELEPLYPSVSETRTMDAIFNIYPPLNACLFSCDPDMHGSSLSLLTDMLVTAPDITLKFADERRQDELVNGIIMCWQWL